MKLGTICVVLATAACLRAQTEEVTLKAEKAFVITFPSQENRTYKVLGAESSGGPWRSLQDGIGGTGGAVTVFYKSESDQKLFFKVEGREGAPASPARQSFLSLARLDLSEQNFAGAQFSGEDFKLFTLSGANFVNANLNGANFRGTVANNASFAGADLRGLLTDQNTRFNGANFSGANLEGTQFSAPIDNADFRNAKLSRAVFWNSMAHSDFRGATLNGAIFNFVNLNSANFSGQSLSNAAFHYCVFDFADLTRANLGGADLSRCYLRSTRLDGAIVTNANLEGAIIEGVPMAGRDLRGSLLRGSVLSGDWSGLNAPAVDASLIFASARGTAKYLPANLSGANLSGANLEGAVFEGVNLAGANLRNAKLQGADLRAADLRNVDFTGADLSFTELTRANLTGATGFNLEQAGMNLSSTVLPDGITRTARTSGMGLASTSVPGRLRFEISDLGAVYTRELTFTGGTFSEPGQPGGGFTYTANGMIGGLALALPNQGIIADSYTLLFTSATGGKLFKNTRGGTAGVFLIGTFTLPQ